MAKIEEGNTLTKMSQPTRFFSWLLLLQLVLLLTVGAACLATGGSPVGYVTVAFLGVAGAWAGAYLIHRFVERQHRDFIRTTQGIRDAARSGETHLLLRTERADDSFGKLANELNASSECVAASVAELHSRCRHLERNDTLFHAILGTMVEGVLVLDSSQNVLYVNDAARNMLNCTGRGIEGRPVWELIRASEFESLLSATELMEDNYRKEVTLPRNKTVVEVTAARLPIEPAPGTVLVLHNVTELRKLERMRREFVSNVSHELKTPLTSIQAYAETLLDSVHDDPERTPEFISRILEQTERLRTLIHDMLRLARIESQFDAFALESVSVAELLGESFEARRAVADARHVSLVMAPLDEELFVNADRSGLLTVFDNLITNAINYSPEHGQVEIRCHGTSGEVIVEVEDHGIGIAAEHRERIFERFYRIDKARTRGGVGGTGLGLAIVKHLVQLFGGEIELESELGRGSLFRVRFPRLAQPANSLQPANFSAPSA